MQTLYCPIGIVSCRTRVQFCLALPEACGNVAWLPTATEGHRYERLPRDATLRSKRALHHQTATRRQYPLQSPLPNHSTLRLKKGDTVDC